MELIATALSVGIGLSTHINTEKTYNEFHPYVAYSITDNVDATLYYNSNKDISLAVGYTYDLGYGVSITGGLVSGYEPLPIYPYAKLNYDLNDRARLTLAPLVDEDVGLILAIEFKH